VSRVLLAVEQLRRDVPGGIGTYARGLLGGLETVMSEGRGDGPHLEIGLLASRAPGDPRGRGWAARRADGRAHAGVHAGVHGVDPLDRFGWPVHASRLPGRLLTRAWDHRLASPPSGYDVVHAVSLAAPPVRGRQGQRRAALVVTVHDLAWRAHPETSTTRGRRWHDASLARALSHADGFVVPSRPVAADLIAAGADPVAVTVIGEGADHLADADHAGASALLRRHGVSGGYLLTVGTREPRKNLGRLVAAYGAARASLPEPWPLVVVGPRGWGAPGAGGAVVGTGGRSWDEVLATPGVVAVGAVPDPVLAGLYASAVAFAYVPVAEGFGLPPLEAMTFGVPVVASTTVPSVEPGPGSPPVAALVDPFDVDAIAASLVAVSTDAGRRASLIAAATAGLGGRTWRRAAEAHVELWDRLAGRAR
jgi:glycosyltransferase involved in cell wall biosynthesis